MKKITNEGLKKYILAHNPCIDEYMVLQYKNLPFKAGYFNIFNDCESVVFSRGKSQFWDIIKTSDTLENLICGWNGQ